MYKNEEKEREGGRIMNKNEEKGRGVVKNHDKNEEKGSQELWIKIKIKIARKIIDFWRIITAEPINPYESFKEERLESFQGKS